MDKLDCAELESILVTAGEYWATEARLKALKAQLSRSGAGFDPVSAVYGGDRVLLDRPPCRPEQFRVPGRAGS